MFPSLEELGRALEQSGYICDTVTTSTIFLSARLQKPLLLEGPAGSGKTQLAYAVAEAAGTVVERLQCYEGINEEKTIGKFDESLQRLCVELQSKAADVDWDCLRAQLHGRQFFTAGPLLRALETSFDSGVLWPSTLPVSRGIAKGPVGPAQCQTSNVSKVDLRLWLAGLFQCKPGS